MAKAKKKYRHMKAAERKAAAEPVKKEIRKRKYVIEKMRKAYRGYAFKEDYKRGRLL